MVSRSLRTWFVVHFIADMVVGLPLLFAPRWFFGIFGWESVDAFSARVVGAALMGIGWESLLGRNADAAHYRGMLRLKLIWAGSAIAGMTMSLLSDSVPAVGWVFVAVFAIFFIVWAYYAVRLNRSAA